MNDIDGSPVTMSQFGAIGYATLEPGNSSMEEQVSFTGITQNSNGTATLTGIQSVGFVYPYTSTSGLSKTHPGSTSLVISNTSGFYSQAGFKTNNEILTGFWEAQDPLTDQGLATKKYVDDLVSGGITTSAAVIAPGTAGETVSAGQVLYLKVADGFWYKASSATAATTDLLQLGIAQGSGTFNNPITGGVLLKGYDQHQSGLTPGTIYYLSTGGAISSSAGTVERAIGQASSITILYFDPVFYYVPTANQKAAFVGNFGTPSSSNKFLTQTGTVVTTAGAADVSKIPRLNASGLLDTSVIPVTATAVTLIPPSAIVPGGESGTTSIVVSSNTTAFLGQVIVPFGITVNKITVRTGDAVATPGTFDLSLYSEDGQTQKFSVTTASVASIDTLYTTAVSSVVLAPGVYYIMINPNGTANAEFRLRLIASVPFSTTASLANDVASEPVMQGSITISASTPPSTFDPTTITDATNRTIIFRLDN